MRPDRTFFNRKDLFWIILLSVIVLLPNFYLTLYGSDLAGSLLKKIVYLTISVLIFLLPSLLLKAKSFFIFQSIFVLLAPIEMIHIFMNRMPVTTGFLLAITDTNQAEILELLLSVQLLGVFCLILFAFYFYVAIKKVNNTYFIHSVAKRLSLLGISVIILAGGYAYYFILNHKITPDKETVFSKTNRVFLMKFGKIYPCDILIIGRDTYSLKREIRKGQKQVKDFRFHAVRNTILDQKEVYLFIIGETARYSNFSINGYHRETTPLLSEIDNLISYSDFFSEANYTSFSLPTILTRSTAQEYTHHFQEKSFVDAFQEAGFKTYWLGNQGGGESLVRRIAKDADGECFFTGEYDAEGNYDEKLWVPLDDILSRGEDKVLIVMHTLGSHFRYNFRYPDSFNRFTPSFEGTFDYALISPKNKELFINTYDNSILYTDYFLANTIRKIDSLNCISSLMYVSDHGENLYDTDQQIILHGGTIYTSYDFHVPFLVWTSCKYGQEYPEKVRNMIENRDKKLSAGNIFYSILDMADITFPEQLSSRSITSDSLQTDSVRYIIDPNMERQLIKW